MKKSVIIFPLFCLLIFILISFGYAANKKTMIKKYAADGFAVVELFTSEGCSSCPPADKAVALIQEQFPGQVYLLGFHVDYWNNLGWTDKFSMPAFSNRQRRYGEVFELNSIYTPQIVVNGHVQFTGSDKNKLQHTVSGELAGNKNIHLELMAECKDQKNVLVNIQGSADNSSLLNIALVQVHANSDVRSGENKGMNLSHINIVRELKIVNTGTFTTTFVLPEGLSSGNCKIIAFVQNKLNMRIYGAVQSGIK